MNPGRALGIDALRGDLRPAKDWVGVIHPPDRAVRRAHCGLLAFGSDASGARRGLLGRTVPV